MKQNVRRLFVVLYVLWGILYLFIFLSARQLAAPMMANPAFVSELIRALVGAGAILVPATVVTFAILQIRERRAVNKLDALETAQPVSTKVKDVYVIGGRNVKHKSNP